MDQKELTKALKLFSDSVEIQAKNNLAAKDKNASGGLSESITSFLKMDKSSFELSFFLEDYWKFIDYGVKGIGGKKADGDSWELKEVTNNKFSYKEGIENRPAPKHFNNWTVLKGIAPRNKKGQFTTRKGLMFAISNSVWHTGLETTSFFTKPFYKEFNKLRVNLRKAFSIDVKSFIEFSLKK